MPKNLWYLAAPYTHNDPYVVQKRVLEINHVAGHLFNLGYFIYSPISMVHPIKEVGNLSGGWDFWKNYAELMLSRCDGLMIATLEGWKTSVGVTGEREIASKLGLEERFIDPTTLIMFDEEPSNVLKPKITPTVNDKVTVELFNGKLR